jgi:twitching motility two-component system response regulator PilH
VYKRTCQLEGEVMAKHIMVFNDTQEILELFNDILTEEGYRVSLGTFSPQELEMVRAAQPDLVIADYPPLDREARGWQLIQKMKMARETAHIPIIVCTTNLRAIEHNEGWLAKQNILTIPKPFTIDELLNAVHSQIERLTEPSAESSEDQSATPDGD